ncbi:MAG: hypothetical protein KDE19_06710 [Caldilineaceae bacterium]|nr:hypothetical protein [Caldilineaceae bacterium]
MDQYELRTTPKNSTTPDPTAAPAPDPATDADPNTPTSATHLGANPAAERRSTRAGEVDAVLRALATLQRQQSEQTHLLRQLVAEIEQLKATQSQQGSTVTRLDRRLRWARFWRLGWLLLRIAFFGGIVWFLVYLIGLEQIQAMWERLVWLLT